MDVYRLRVHLFGATSSPAVANFALRRSARDAVQAGLVPSEAAEAVKSNFYVDDCLKSVATSNEAIALAQGIVKACAYGGFTLSKFVSNDVAFLQSLPKDKLSKDLSSVDLSREGSVDVEERALGVVWEVKEDTFTFGVKKLALPLDQFNRRSVLSTLSSLYDPLGMAAPVVIRARVLFRVMTSSKPNDWDAQIDSSSDIGQRWTTWIRQLQDLRQVHVPRCLRSREAAKKENKCQSWQLHVFCDASQEAYAAVAFVRNTDGHVSFVMGKARVSPPKAATIPRLELVAAKLGAELASTVEKELQYDIIERFFWTDSETVLKYLHNRSKRFHTFVANRVGAIMALTKIEEWRHVPTKENPADEATRGLAARELMDSMWINGPGFLRNATLPATGSNPDFKIHEDDPELKKEQLTFGIQEVQNTPEDDFMEQLLSRCSTMAKVRKAVAVWLGFKAYLRTPRAQAATLPALTWGELQQAEQECIKHVQRRQFQEDLRDCKQQDGPLSVRRQSPLFCLSPVLHEGVVCTDSRVRPRKLPIIPRGRLAELLVEEAHRQQLHFGRQSTMSHTMSRYWVIGLNALARRIVHDCSSCQRRHAKPLSAVMAPLPAFRTTPTGKAFEFVGVDCFGPFSVGKEKEGKAYGVIFTCAVSRAIHLEVAEDLSAAAFINALRRFIARRGNVRTLVSDNGNNFVGANKEMDRELKKAVRKFSDSPTVQQEMRARQIEWLFNPPGASHHGGFWERLIRSVRQALSAVAAAPTIPLSISSLETLLCECEAVINNRPITAVSEDQADPEPLTPNHLLLSRGAHFEPTQPPPGDYNRVAGAIRHHWKRVQHLATSFWRQWLKCYRVLLHHRSKWNTPVKRMLRVNDIVLVIDPVRPRQYWKLGRVLKTFPSAKDGVVRSAEVKTMQGVHVRPITKLCLLETASDLIQ